MSTHHSIGLLSVPALTLLVAVGFFVPGAPANADQTDPGAVHPASVPALTPLSRGVGEEPAEACPLLSAAPLTLSAAPERLRVRPWLRCGHAGVDRHDVAAPQPLPPSTSRSFLRGAASLLRLAIAVGRCSAPTTAPPAFSL